MLDKEKLSLNARLGLKMGACVEAYGSVWKCIDHRGSTSPWKCETPELTLNSCYERSYAGCLRFDSDDVPRWLLCGLQEKVLLVGKWCEFLKILHIDPYVDIAKGSTFDIATMRSAAIADAADAVLPWPEGI